MTVRVDIKVFIVDSPQIKGNAREYLKGEVVRGVLAGLGHWLGRGVLRNTPGNTPKLIYTSW